MRLKVIGSSMTIAMICVAATPLAASPFVREIDAYCVSRDGVRQGVAASQDGATNAYVQHPGQPPELTRSVHSRRTVSHWHAQLDAAGFKDMEGPELDAPYCAIQSVQAGQVHIVQWRDREAPPAALVDLFATMLDAKPSP
jgi:hypothetical protein